jgi:N utilization substance protein B
VLYAADVRAVDPLDVLQEELEKQADGDDADLDTATLDRFAVTLLHGLGGSMPEVDERIARFARGWRLERMPAIDRNVLRLAVHELLTEPTPIAVVMDEAVRLASELSTDDSGRYVNGVLAAIVRDIAKSAERQVPDTELPAAPALDLDEGPTSPADEVTRLGLELALEGDAESEADSSPESETGDARD